MLFHIFKNFFLLLFINYIAVRRKKEEGSVTD